MTASETPSVFISYRREGTAMHAGRLYDAMAARFGEHNVFMDLEMAPGIDFVERITTAVGSCRALIVVIGPQWMGPGGSRIADPDDFVRLEVETALRAADVTVIPVLVEGARMPAPERLPAELRPLARRNAIELSDLRWRYDCQRLMTALDDLLGEQAVAAGAAPRAAVAQVSAVPAPTRALLPLWLEGVVVAVAAGMLARWLGDGIRPTAEDPTDMAKALTLIARRAEVWAVVGGALAVWLSVRRGGERRLFSRIVLGLLIGACAGALGGLVFAVGIYLPDPNASAELARRISIASLAATGGLLGAAIGVLWIPRRVGAGLLGGLVGGVLVQLGTNTFGHPGDVLAVGWACLSIVGLALFAMLALDVRAATAPRPAAAAPEAARA